MLVKRLVGRKNEMQKLSASTASLLICQVAGRAKTEP
jgi:hypothetical protein